MKMALFLSLYLLAVLITCQGAPAPPLFVDEKADVDSKNLNEVGPEEDWQLYDRLMKTKSFDPSDSEKNRALLKEIEEFSQLVTQANATDEPDSTTYRPEVSETHSASSDWFSSTWKNSKRNGDEDTLISIPQFEKQDEGVEDIIKKLSNEMKKLYLKIKQAITVMKNWVNNARGSTNEFDGPSPMFASASESDGVFLIADPLFGDIDKSNKYTLPINAD